MNPEIKARWVAALRSGKYSQARSVLKGAEGFCCLGVLCDLYAADKGLTQWNSLLLGARGEELPSSEVTEWAGLPHKYDDASEPRENDVRLEIGGATRWVSSHNDGDELTKPQRPGATFAEIADAIEAQL